MYVNWRVADRLGPVRNGISRWTGYLAAVAGLGLLALFLARAPLTWAVAGPAGCALFVAIAIEPAAGPVAIALAIPFSGLVPLPLPGGVGAVDLLVALTLTAWLTQGVARRALTFRPPPLTWPLLALVWVLALSLTQAASWREGLPEWLKWAEFAALYLVGTQVLERRHVWWLLGALLAAGLAEVALGAYQFVRQVGPEAFVLMGRFMRAYGTFRQPNPYAGYLGCLAPVAVSLALAALGRWWAGRGPSTALKTCEVPGTARAIFRTVFHAGRAATADEKQTSWTGGFSRFGRQSKIPARGRQEPANPKGGLRTASSPRSGRSPWPVSLGRPCLPWHGTRWLGQETGHSTRLGQPVLADGPGRPATAGGGEAIFRTDFWLGLVCSGVALALIVGIGLSWSRGAWLGLAISLLVVLGLRNRRAALWTTAGLLTLALTVALFGTGWLPEAVTARLNDLGNYISGPDPTRTEITDANFAVLERVAHWQAGLKMFDDHPWLGIGIGNYAVAYAAYALPHWYESLGHAHNVYLNFLAEAGVLGAGAFILFWLSAVWVAGRTVFRTDGQRALAIGVLGTLVYLSVHNLFDNLFVSHIQLQLALLLGGLAVQKDNTV